MQKGGAIVLIILIFFSSTAWHPGTGDNNLAKRAVEPSKHRKKIIFIAGGCTHGPMTHEYRAGSIILANGLKQSLPGEFETVIYDKGWPEDNTVFDNASAVVMYLDGGEGHLVMPHLEQMNVLANKGVGIACLHFAVEVPKGKAGNLFLSWIGGYFETDWSVNPYWKAEFTEIPKHPVTNGVKPFVAADEWYYHMRFPESMKNVTPILSVVPPASTLNRPDGRHENNAFARADRINPQHLAWVTERSNGGRGFGFTGGHSHRNWANDDFRKLVLNAIAWIAHTKVPKDGLVSLPIPQEALKDNLDKKPCSVNK